MAADEDLQQQLKGFHEQLDQINAALVLDADNEELLLLKANLEELVVLTQQEGLSPHQAAARHPAPLVPLWDALQQAELLLHSCEA